METTKDQYNAKRDDKVRLLGVRLNGVTVAITKTTGKSKIERLKQERELEKLDVMAKRLLTEMEACSPEHWQSLKGSFEKRWNEIFGSLEALWDKINAKCEARL